MKMRSRGGAACSKDRQRLALKLADALKLLYDKKIWRKLR